MEKPSTRIQAEKHPYIRRFFAFLIDWYVSSFIAVIPILVFQSINGKDLVIVNRIDTLPMGQAIVCMVLAVAVYILYFCILPVKARGKFASGQTLGRRLLKIAVVKTDSRPLAFPDLLLRDFVGILLLQGNTTNINIYLMSIAASATGNSDFLPYLQSFYFLVLGLSLILLFTKKHQMVHDLISRTRIVCSTTPSPAELFEK